MSELKFGMKIQCKSCNEDIFSNSRLSIKCAVCDELYLCVECFAGKVELGSHRPDHAFKYIDNFSFSIFKNEWTACEHIRLLNAVEQYGFGNWEDIARQINTAGTTETGPSTNWSKKTPQQAKEEYCQIFIDGIIGKCTWSDEDRPRAHDHTIDNFLTPQSTNEPQADLTVNESLVIGYFPSRDDFEVEFDNGAENLVSLLDDYQNTGSVQHELTPEEEELESALKIAHVEMYKSKLRERERRKRVSRDHQLVSQYLKEYPLNKSQPKSKKSKDLVLEKLKIWAELLGVKEHQNLMASVGKERELKNRIRDLNKFRKNGIHLLSDAQEYEIQKSRRSHKKKLEKKKLIQQTESADVVILSPSNSVISDELSNGSYNSPFQMSPMPSSAGNGQEKPASNLIERSPGYEILSSNEKKLCTNLHLTPAHYMSYKTCLIFSYLQKKKGQTPKLPNPAGLDKHDRKIIFNFLMRAGWITAF